MLPTKSAIGQLSSLDQSFRPSQVGRVARLFRSGRRRLAPCGPHWNGKTRGRGESGRNFDGSPVAAGRASRKRRCGGCQGDIEVIRGINLGGVVAGVGIGNQVGGEQGLNKGGFLGEGAVLTVTWDGAATPNIYN